MQLLTPELRAQLLAADAQYISEDGEQKVAVGDRTVLCKFFNPTGRATWWIISGESIEDESGNEEDFYFFGFADIVGPDCAEWGTVALSELKSFRGLAGLGIERDLNFTPAPVSKVLGSRYPTAF